MSEKRVGVEEKTRSDYPGFFVCGEGSLVRGDG
jgi:hypothetical protein